jgi:quercetin dioxygenase-like cupin family protein
VQVIRRRDTVRSLDPEHFTGQADLERYTMVVVGGYLVALVIFDPGSSTHWHSHPRGQVLYVVSGAGFVEDSDGVTEFGEGDLVIADPRVRHRHGAKAGSAMSHLSVTQEAARWED